MCKERGKEGTTGWIVAIPVFPLRFVAVSGEKKKRRESKWFDLLLSHYTAIYFFKVLAFSEHSNAETLIQDRKGKVSNTICMRTSFEDNFVQMYGRWAMERLSTIKQTNNTLTIKRDRGFFLRPTSYILAY